jgi:EAL domain-containing protein (putative c-di-GMP-specific phosphodiesterase class I)
MKARLQERRDLEQDLRYAVQHDQFTVVFQPRFDIRGRRILGAEALVRWDHPEKGLLSPAVFIPLAEETGLIVALSDIVMRRACELVAGWPEPVFVSVNLSCIDFMRSDLAARVERVLRASGLAPGRLEIEVTESVMMDDAEHALAVMSALKGLGVKLSMDDFGTGFSSLSYLSRYPFDGIKIDRSFVMNLSDPKANNQAIVSAVVALGKSLGMVVTAEGVETPEQLEALAGLGCHQAQGYLLGRPMAPMALARLLAEQGRAAKAWPVVEA